MISVGTDLSARDPEGRTVLINAVMAEKAKSDIVQVLLAAGSDPNAKDDAQQWAALHYAARDQKQEIVDVLLKHGADVDPVDVFGNTPLWRCLMNRLPNHAVVRMLLAHGADPDRKNKNGASPKDVAKTLNHKDILAELERDRRDT